MDQWDNKLGLVCYQDPRIQEVTEHVNMDNRETPHATHVKNQLCVTLWVPQTTQLYPSGTNVALRHNIL